MPFLLETSGKNYFNCVTPNYLSLRPTIHKLMARLRLSIAPSKCTYVAASVNVPNDGRLDSPFTLLCIPHPSKLFMNGTTTLTVLYSGSSKVDVVDHGFLNQDDMLHDIRANLQQAQHMKAYYDRGHRDIKFNVGSLVGLRLHPYR